MKKLLVVGGTSGLGLELGKLLKSQYDTVVVTGRTWPKQDGLLFYKLRLDAEIAEMTSHLDDLVDYHGPFDTVIYSAGFYQPGHVDTLNDGQIEDITRVVFEGAVLLVARLLARYDHLPCFVAISSTSQFTPREFEPVYTGAKAALAMFTQSLSLDPRVGKTLVVAPAGMNTPFYANSDRDVSGMLDAHWVAEKIMRKMQEEYKYRFVEILRDPPRIGRDEICLV